MPEQVLPHRAGRSVAGIDTVLNAHGYGVVGDDHAAGCQPHEATVLYLGKLGANEQSVLRLPLPNGLQSRGVKRITATLAWLPPVNWQHRQYRRAALNFSKPSGFTDLGTSVDTDAERSKRGTLQHTVWEVTRAVAADQGSDLELTVQCAEQAGGLQGERVDFAVVLTLWVAPELGVEVYTQVQQQITTAVTVTPDAQCRRARDVAIMWQDDQPRPTAANADQHVVAGQPHKANNSHQHPLSVPRFPWYY